MDIGEKEAVRLSKNQILDHSKADAIRKKSRAIRSYKPGRGVAKGHRMGSVALQDRSQGLSSPIALPRRSCPTSGDSLRRYSQSRCESPRPFYWCILNASNEQESRMCLALRRIFAEMTRGVFNFPVGCATFADKQCAARKLESVLVPQSISEQCGHSQSGDAI